MASNKKFDCKYGKDCYRNNPEHLEKYNHTFQEEQSLPVDSENLKRKLPSDNAGLDDELKTHHDEEPDDSKKAKNEADRRPGPSTKEMDITKEYEEVLNNLSGVNYLELYQRRVKYSQKAEYADLLKTPEIFIRHKFFVEMPSEFYKFWEFCKTISTEKNPPQKVFEKFGLLLVGPFDYMAGNFHDAKLAEPAEYLRHWRFYYDPPEFQTVFVKKSTCLHYGYWRDDPKDKENLLMAKNNSDKDCEFEFVGANCFETILNFLDTDCNVNPFNKLAASALKASIQNFVKEHDIPLKQLKALILKRDKTVVCKTFHRAGLVVPYDRKADLGYRALLESDSSLKKMLMLFEKGNSDVGLEALQPLLTAANIAVDECDFGAALELGIDLFCSGYEVLHEVLSPLLITAYSLLKKPQFIAIIKSHLASRKRGHNLSILE